MGDKKTYYGTGEIPFYYHYKRDNWIIYKTEHINDDGGIWCGHHCKPKKTERTLIHDREKYFERYLEMIAKSGSHWLRPPSLWKPWKANEFKPPMIYEGRQGYMKQVGCNRMSNT